LFRITSLDIRQLYDRRKQAVGLCKIIRQNIANYIDGGEEYICVVCRIARDKRSQVGESDYKKASSFEILYFSKYLLLRLKIACSLRIK
jgi:hypothetical protein